MRTQMMVGQRGAMQARAAENTVVLFQTSRHYIRPDALYRKGDDQRPRVRRAVETNSLHVGKTIDKRPGQFPLEVADQSGRFDVV